MKQSCLIKCRRRFRSQNLDNFYKKTRRHRCEVVSKSKKKKKKQYNIFEKRVYKKNYSWTTEELHDQNKINIQNL